MGNFKLSNSILQEGKVVEAANENVVRVELPDGSFKEIPAYSPESKGHHCHLQKGESVVLVFLKNAFEITISGVRQHILQTIIYPQDENHEKILQLEKNPVSKEEHHVEVAFEEAKKKREEENEKNPEDANTYSLRVKERREV